MRKLILMIVAIIFVAGLSTSVKSQTRISTNASANVVSALILEKDRDLNFGTMSSPTDDVDVTLSTTNALTSTDATKILLLPTGFATANYKISGEINLTYSITLPLDNTVTISQSGAYPMKVENFQALIGTGNVNGTSGTFNATGKETFVVGATLKVGKAQKSGSYTGTYDILVAYN